ncbi:CFEM domain-containing protein [Stagonosporopsis vannaccii]|nr:CFEM domain-containing protein [Stagonosporopsis vannaccii]
MKQSMILLAAIAGAATAQNLGSCAQLCVNNMNRIANTEFSCAAGDTACFCSQSNWAYGVRDCSREACNDEEAGQAVSYAAGLCQVTGVASTIGDDASASPSAALTILNPAVSSAGGATGTASGEASATGSASLSAITTVPLVATVTNSDGDVQTTTSGFSTVYSSGALTESAASAASSAASSIASELSSGLASISESASSALASATESLASAASSATDSAGSAISSATDAAGSAASSATDAAGSAVSSAVPAGAAAKMTGVPVAAGLAAAAWFII